MNNPLVDMRSISIETATSQDKRTLVLFLFGLMLLFFDICPRSGTIRPQFYGIVSGEATQPWRLLSLSAAKASNPSEIQAIFNLAAYSTVVPLLSQKKIGPDVPAALSLFVNAPFPINRADKAALEMLPGVGPHLAQAILNTRQQNGTFAEPDDLLEVSGIGPKNIQRLLPLLSFE